MSRVTAASAASREEQTVLVGAAGHRFLDEPQKIADAVDEALARIASLHPTASMIVLSALAEGADQIIAERALAIPGWALHAVLPMEQTEYEATFATPGAVDRFRGILARAQRVVPIPRKGPVEEAYAVAGDHVLDKAQYLIVVWDGSPPQGPAGTGALVEKARRRSIPMAWIRAGNRTPGTKRATSQGSRQGELTFERFSMINATHGTPKPLSNGETERRIAQLQADLDTKAKRYAGQRLSFAFFAVALGPLAVALLAAQVLGDLVGLHAQLLIGAEALLLGMALALGYLHVGSFHFRWLDARLRAEILRREQWLAFFGVGPYLDAPNPKAILDDRLEKIGSAIMDPWDLLPLQNENGEEWNDALLQRGGRSPLPGRVDECARRYLADRVKHQKDWFERRTSEHARRARVYENLAKLVLILALVVAMLHFGELYFAKKVQDDHFNALAFAAIILPAIGAMLAGLLSVSGSHRLSRSYKFHAGELLRLESKLRRIRDDDPAEASREFRVLVLRVESVLTSELRLFWLIMHTEAPRAGA